VTQKAAWTVLVYLAGDNNLSSAVETDLREMRTVGSSEDVNVVVQYDTAGDTGTIRHRIEKAGAGEEPERFVETDSGDPQTLVDFVTWAAALFPAEHYALVLWNHGGGWEPSEMERIAERVGAPEFTGREAGERSASPLAKVLFRSTLERIFQLPTAAERAICSDDGTGHSLDTIELAGVLEKAVAALGQPLDLLGMDACLMSNLEVAYEVAPFARYMVASEENEPNNGWPWDAVLGRLVAQPEMPARQLAGSIADDYVRFYVDAGHRGPVTQAAFDLSHAAGVAEALDGLAGALLAALPDAAGPIWNAQRASARFWHNTLWDLGDFCRCLGSRVAEPAVQQAAGRVVGSLVPGGTGFVVRNVHNGASVARCDGLTVYLVPQLTDISPWYADLALSKTHRWDEMLVAYHQA
jgi:hypothetical protein